MAASLHDWINRIKNQPLPAMAYTVQSISALMARSSTTHADYQRIVARDPGFSLSIFRHLETLPRPPREPISTLVHAVALAGTAPLEAGINQLPVIRNHANDGGKRGLLACYSCAVHAAMYLSHWGAIRKDPNTDELMLAALLRDCGEMTLWSEAPEQMAAFALRIERGLSRENAALAVFGFTLDQLSLGLAEVWKLPALIAESLAPDSAFRVRPLGVMLACELARSSAADWGSGQTMELIDLVAEYCRQRPDLTAASVHSLSAETARQLQGLDLPLSATTLLQLHPGSAKAPQHTAEQAKFTAASLTCSTPDVGNGDALPVVRLSGSPLQIQLTRTMQQLRDNAGLERAMFAMLTPDRKMLRAKFIIGAEQEAAIKTFQVSLEKRHLFKLLMAKSQSFWLNTDNRKKYLPAIPQYLHNTLNIEGFFISSLFIDDKPIGILYADANDTIKLNNRSFTFFKQLVLQLSTALAGERKAQAVG